MSVRQAESTIVSDPGIFGGKPIVRGTRISVELIIDWIDSGVTVDQILDDFPNLKLNDIEAAIAYSKRDLLQKVRSDVA